MNLQQLEYLIKIAKTQNFTVAAAELSVTQPALSKSIAKLEEELGVPLFERTNKSFKLTAFGSAFLTHAASALKEIETGVTELENMKGRAKKSIAIASTYCIITYFIPFIISGFLDSFPYTKFEFKSEGLPEIFNDLKERKIDLGFFDSNEKLVGHKDIEFIPVKKEEYVLIVPKKHALANQTEVSIKDLKQEAFIAICENESQDRLISYSEFMERAPQISIAPSEASMLGGLVAAGAGITIVPYTPLINTNALSVVKLKENIGYKTIYMGWLKNSPLPDLAQQFKAYVISNLDKTL